MINKLIGIVFISSCTVAFLVSGPVWAQTGDDIVPAIEEVCDDDPFSFGLCNAYCEALDCDSATPIGSPTACGRVLGNYMRHSDGLLPPCESACPCNFDLEGDLAHLAADFEADTENVFTPPTIDFDTLGSLCETIFGETTFIAEAFNFEPGGLDTPQGIRLLYWVDAGEPATCNEEGGAIDGTLIQDPENYFNFDYPPPYLMNQEDLADADEEAACRQALADLCASLD